MSVGSARAGGWRHGSERNSLRFHIVAADDDDERENGDGSDTAGLKGGMSGAAERRSGGAESSFSQRRLGRRDVGLEWTGLDGLLAAAAAADLNGALIGDIRGPTDGRRLYTGREKGRHIVNSCLGYTRTLLDVVEYLGFHSSSFGTKQFAQYLALY